MNPVKHTAKLPSERSFGLLFTCFFAGVGLYGFYKAWPHGSCIAWLIASCAIAVITFSAPRLLAPFNRAWFRLGELMGKLVSPIVLGIIFFGVLTPLAMISRAFGRDELRLKRSVVDSYWIERTPAGPEAESFKNQF